MGMTVHIDLIQSDSGVNADLLATFVCERIELGGSDGILAGVLGNPFPCASSIQDLSDQHFTPADLVHALGWSLTKQVHVMRDLRTGITDLPILNSGFTIYREIYVSPPGSMGWGLLTEKVAAATDANQIAAQAGIAAGPMRLEQ